MVKKRTMKTDVRMRTVVEEKCNVFGYERKHIKGSLNAWLGTRKDHGRITREHDGI